MRKKFATQLRNKRVRLNVVFCLCATIVLSGSLSPAQTAGDAVPQIGNRPSAESDPVPPRLPRQVEPIVIERKVSPPEAAGSDPRRRMTFYPGGQRKGCQPWRLEVSARPDGEVIFQVNEPADRQVVMAGRGDDQSQEFVLGDPDCNFRVKIERGK